MATSLEIVDKMSGQAADRIG